MKSKFSVFEVIMVMIFVIVASTVTGQNKTNVVIMLGDNVGYGDIGACGAGKFEGYPLRALTKLPVKDYG